MENITLRVAGIMDNCITNGQGIRKVIFLQGCNHKCPGCFNQHTWDMNGGVEYNIDQLYDMIMEDKHAIDGVTFSGGDPFEQSRNLSKLLRKLKQQQINIWCYTGYDINFIMEAIYLKRHDKLLWDELMNNIDYLVEGPFIQELADPKLLYRGSSNQNIIDVQELIKSGKIKIFEES